MLEKPESHPSCQMEKLVAGRRQLANEAGFAAVEALAAEGFHLVVLFASVVGQMQHSADHLYLPSWEAKVARCQAVATGVTGLVVAGGVAVWSFAAEHPPLAKISESVEPNSGVECCFHELKQAPVARAIVGGVHGGAAAKSLLDFVMTQQQIVGAHGFAPADESTAELEHLRGELENLPQPVAMWLKFVSASTLNARKQILATHVDLHVAQVQAHVTA